MRWCAALLAAVLVGPMAARASDTSPKSFRDCAVCPEMVSVPPGSFTMGVPAGEEEREDLPKNFKGHGVPQHQVSIARGFALGKYAVTRGEFAAFVRDTGYQAGDRCNVWHKVEGQWKYSEESGYSWRNPNFSQTDRHPVVCVNWYEAKAYVAWLSRKTGHTYRLPSEAEREYAARAGSQSARFWGDDSDRACAYANAADLTFASTLDRNKAQGFQCTDGYAYTAPVGSFRPNKFGLYDMLGNVWEYNEDCWNANYQGAPADGSAWLTGDCGRRVDRGFSWYSNPGLIRSGQRDQFGNSRRDAGTGFRVARDQ